MEAASSIVKELVLACDASRGACRVAKTRASASRTVLLRCGDDDAAATAEHGSEWAFTAYDVDGAQRWTINLMGSDADLPRSAAMFAVRFETGDEPRPAKPFEAPAAAAPASVPARSEPARSEPEESASSSSSTGKVLTYAGFGVAILGLGSGLAVALSAKLKQDELDDVCKPQCSQSKLDAVKAQFTVAEVLLGVGAAGAVTGIVGAILWANTPSSAGTRGRSVSTVRATAGAGWVGLAGSF